MTTSLNQRNLKPKILNIRDFNPDADPANRQRIIPGWDQELLKRTRVLVAGAGALGNEIIKCLIMLGFGTIYTVDFDIVVKSNLNRCIFFRPDDAEQKRPKVEAISARGKELDPYGYVEIIPIIDEIGSQGINYSHPIFTEKKVDLVFGTFDNVASRIHMTIIAYYHNIPYIDGGMWGPIGNVFVMLPPSSPCYVCSLSDESWVEMMKRLQCSMRGIVEGPEMPSLPTTSSVVAALQVQEALKILFSKNSSEENLGLGRPAIGKMISVNLITNDWVVYDVLKRPDCPVCSNVGRRD
ncbi:MAG: ThiF family adenylyltransferase [Candidatus Bathyarchaeia archaeon]